jgi:hypothetical protein
MSFCLLALILCRLFDEACRWLPQDVHPVVLVVELILISALLTASLLLYLTSLGRPACRQDCFGQLSS